MRPQAFLIWTSGVVNIGFYSQSLSFHTTASHKGHLSMIDSSDALQSIHFLTYFFMSRLDFKIFIAWCVSLPRCVLSFRDSNIAPILLNGEVLKTKINCYTRVYYDKEIWHISVRLSDRSEVTQHKINFVKNCPPVGFEPMTSWSSVSCSANWAREESVGDFWSELSFVSCTTSHFFCLFLKSIEHDFKGLGDSHPQPNSDLVQLPEHETDDPEVVSSKPTEGHFLTKFILFCCNFRCVR